MALALSLPPATGLGTGWSMTAVPATVRLLELLGRRVYSKGELFLRS